jgi:K+-transporting ATPase ATPase C chain
MKPIKNAALLLVALTVLTGIVYPLGLAALGRVFFPRQAGGSLIYRDGRVAGSRLIGRQFTGSGYFRPRPSAGDYDGMRSGGSNLGPSSPALADSVASRRSAFRRANLLDGAAEVPPDMLFSSGSGLDPDIGEESAELQMPRVCDARHLSPAQAGGVALLIAGLAREPKSSILSGTRVNVLLLNLALDSLTGLPR